MSDEHGPMESLYSDLLIETGKAIDNINKRITDKHLTEKLNLRLINKIINQTLRVSHLTGQLKGAWGVLEALMKEVKELQDEG